MGSTKFEIRKRAGRRPLIVTLGGGTGQAAVLRGLRRYPCRLAAVAGVTDDGGHSGELRRACSLPQVGDLRQCFEALFPSGEALAEVLGARFQHGSLEGTQLGNLLLAHLAVKQGKLSRAAAWLNHRLPSRLQAWPVSNGSAGICARLENGRVVRGEWNIMRRRSRSPIREVFHEPSLRLLPQVGRLVRAADALVVCPGSLFTALLSVLRTRGMKRAVLESRARLVLVPCLMSQPGQTDGLTAGEHLGRLEEALGRPADLVLLNTVRPAPSLLRVYARRGSRLLEEGSLGTRGTVRRRALVVPVTAAEAARRFGRAGSYPGWLHLIRHDPTRTARAIWRGLRGE